MKKIIFILSIFCLCFSVNNVYALKYVDIKNYNFTTKWEELNITLSGSEAKPKDIFSTSDGGFVIVYESTVIKYSSNFEKEWEKLLQDDSVNDLLDSHTVIGQGTELADGTFLFVGTVGMIHSRGIFFRLDKDGNLLSKTSIQSTSISDAINPIALKNGGYIIKYLHSNLAGGKPTEFETSSYGGYHEGYKFFYVVYDSNNKVVASIPEGEESKLNNYEFIDSKDKDFLIYSINLTKLPLLAFPYCKSNSSKCDEIYLFTTITGDKVFEKSGKPIIYDSLGNVKTTISFSSSHFEPTMVFAFNDGSFMIGNRIFDSNGNKIFDAQDVTEDYRPNQNNSLNSIYEDNISGELSTILNDGTLVRILNVQHPDPQSPLSFSHSYKLEYKRVMQKENDDFAKLVIAGKEIKENIGILLENDRTYISINSLCSYLGCSHKRANSDNDMLVLYFPVFDKNNKFFDGDITFDYGNTSLSNLPSVYYYIDEAFYVVEHRIETKFYQSYLDISPFNIFSLKSPTFDSNSVDVASKIIDGEVYVPIRFIPEVLGRYVTYTPGVNGDKPTINISAAGEGEFYEKFGVVVSKQKYSVGDIVSNIESSSTVDIRTGKVYGYGIDKNTNTVLNTNKTIFFPLSYNKYQEGKPFTDRSANLNDNSNYYVGHFSVKSEDRIGGALHGISCKENYLWKEVSPVYDIDGENYEVVPLNFNLPYLVISSINGYPFLKFVNANAQTN